jgi:hypothetical protein
MAFMVLGSSVMLGSVLVDRYKRALCEQLERTVDGVGRKQIENMLKGT